MSRIPRPPIGLVCALALGLACFGGVFFRGEQFAYRDAAHFYYPLYQRVQQEWAAGRLPLWEPEENGGMPLLGNPTAAVLYPGKLIYAALPYAWAARVYVVSHLIWAMVGMFWLLRSWRVSRDGSWLGTLAYGFGVPVLFQYCNVIFLVGAAWAPHGLRGADRWLRLGQWWGLGELAIALAMQTLGGDPQAAYVVGLCAGGYAIALAGTHRADLGKAPPQSRAIGWKVVGAIAAWTAVTLVCAAKFPAFRAREKPPVVLPWTPYLGGVIALGWGILAFNLWRRSRRREANRAFLPMLFGLGAAGCLAIALTAAQLIPVLEFTRLSVRASGAGPHDMFPFSLEPYRLAELIWPNIYGTSYGTNRSWLPALPPAHTTRLWVPSIYVGGLTLLLAIGAIGFRAARPGAGWLSAIVIVSLAASLGEFGGPLWVARFVPALASSVGPHDPIDVPAIRHDGMLRDGDGSVYGLLATVLPGFGSFRYPSKLLTFTNLGLAGLAGFGWDRLVAGAKRRFMVIGSIVIAIGVIALAAVLLGRASIVAALKANAVLKGNSAFGPFDAAGALIDTRQALVHGAIAMIAAVLVGRLASRGGRFAGVLAMTLMAADLAVANAQCVMTVPQSLLEGTPALLAKIEAAERRDPSPGPFRIHRMALWNPLRWFERSSPARHREFVEWERKTIQPKYAIPFGASYTVTEGTTELYDSWWFFAPFEGVHGDEIAKLVGAAAGTRVVYFPRRGFDLWNTRYFVLPRFASNDDRRGIAAFLPETKPVAPTPDQFQGPGGDQRRIEWVKDEDWQILRNNTAYPRAWIVHDARVHTPIEGLERSERTKIMYEILYQNDPYWSVPSRIVYNPHTLAWIETDDPESLVNFLPRDTPRPTETATITRYEPQRVELDANLESPGLVILADVFYPGWKLAIDGQPAPIYRANRLMRGAAVPSGRHHLVYTYEPASLKAGAAISLAGIAALIGLAFWSRIRPRAGFAPAVEDDHFGPDC